jgi:hypothetical protein
MNGADQLEALGAGSEHRSAGDRLLLQFPAVAGNETAGASPYSNPSSSAVCARPAL